jgi:DNA-binding SARP family transcriptional activator
MLRIQLFGAGHACYFDHELVGFPSQQSYLLLCYLLLNRSHPHLREQLAAVFWGELSAQASRKSLRNALWRLRHSLESIGAPADEYLLTGDESVTLLTSGPLWLDVEVFETVMVHYQDVSVQALTPEDLSRLESAVDLYRGDLLEGIYDDWCLYDRERLRLAHLTALNKLMVSHGLHGAYERGLTFGERILARDPTREYVHQQMMQFYWNAGDRNAALAQYKRCRQILHDELGAMPMEDTRQLHEQMINNTFSTPVPSATPTVPRAFQPGPADGAERLAEHIRQKLRHLHVTFEESRTELYQLESLMASALGSGGHTQQPAPQGQPQSPVRPGLAGPCLLTCPASPQKTVPASSKDTGETGRRRCLATLCARAGASSESPVEWTCAR